jgi:flagellar hook-basal body complex protein FliE
MDPITGDLGVRSGGADFTSGAGAAAGGRPPAAGAFKDLLAGMIDNVDALQKNADASIRELVTGGDVDVHNVAVKLNEAEVAFDLMMEVRNKLLDAYRDIIKMQP